MPKSGHLESRVITTQHS